MFGSAHLPFGKTAQSFSTAPSSCLPLTPSHAVLAVIMMEGQLDTPPHHDVESVTLRQLWVLGSGSPEFYQLGKQHFPAICVLAADILDATLV